MISTKTFVPFPEALSLAKTTMRPIQCEDKNIGKLRMGSDGGLLAFNTVRGQWTTINAIPTNYLNLNWCLLEEREAVNLNAECLGIDFTQQGDKYLTTISLISSSKIVDPEFFADRNVKITIEVDDDAV